jgi:hypothetical protein
MRQRVQYIILQERECDSYPFIFPQRTLTDLCR